MALTVYALLTMTTSAEEVTIGTLEKNITPMHLSIC